LSRVDDYNCGVQLLTGVATVVSGNGYRFESIVYGKGRVRVSLDVFHFDPVLNLKTYAVLKRELAP
jgi:hypothetical protein